jgi:hypothetical protein
MRGLPEIANCLLLWSNLGSITTYRSDYLEEVLEEEEEEEEDLLT